MSLPSHKRMSSPRLSSYDGSAGFLVDTNIWIDCMDPASPWHTWAVDQLQACRSQRATAEAAAAGASGSMPMVSTDPPSAHSL